MLKHLEQSDPDSCLNKAELNEPIFVLRAKDPLFYQAVRAWADSADRLKLHEPEKIEAATKLAMEGADWRRKKPVAVVPKSKRRFRLLRKQ